MYRRLQKSNGTKIRTAANAVGNANRQSPQPIALVNNRPEAIMQRRLMQAINNTIGIVNRALSTQAASKPRSAASFKHGAKWVTQRTVYEKEGWYYSTFDKWEKPYEKREDAVIVDEVLQFIHEVMMDIFEGVGNMEPYKRTRIGRLERKAWPSWIPDVARDNPYVGSRLGKLIKCKEKNERRWRGIPRDPAKITAMLDGEGYPNANDVYKGYCNTNGAQQAGYKKQLEAHLDELSTWNLAQIEPHYIGSQGDTGKRADSLLILGDTQETQSQYFPPGDEPHSAIYVDHKLGYNSKEMAEHLKPSVNNAGMAHSVQHNGEELWTETRFQLHSKPLPDNAVKVIAEQGRSVRTTRPSAFPGGLFVNDTIILEPANRDDKLKRQCGCIGLSNERAAGKINSVVANYMTEQGVYTQVGYHFSLFGSLSEWFDDLCNNVCMWLTPEDIYRLCVGDLS